MKFNFPIFSRLTERAYRNFEHCRYSLDDVLSVFRYYFQEYEGIFEKAHPNIRLEQIESLIDAMPSIDVNGCEAEVSPEDYEILIDQHFNTEYRNCDFNINHFFSGDIRLNRFYEVLYAR